MLSSEKVNTEFASAAKADTVKHIERMAITNTVDKRNALFLLKVVFFISFSLACLYLTCN